MSFLSMIHMDALIKELLAIKANQEELIKRVTILETEVSALRGGTIPKIHRG